MCKKERSQLSYKHWQLERTILVPAKWTRDVRNQWETNIEAPDVTLTVLFQEEKLTSTTKNKKKNHLAIFLHTNDTSLKAMRLM